MNYRTTGTTGLKLSEVTFGAWAAGGWMWGGTERSGAIKAIRSSYDLGVTSIDTAPVYGQGNSEVIVGEAIKGIPRDKLQILTKYGMRWDLVKGVLAFKSRDMNGNDIDVYKYAAKDSIIKECEDSLRRLGTDYIDLYQIHWPDITTPVEETMEAVSKLIDAGKVRYAGVSNYDAALMAEAEKYINLASNQVSYSMINRKIESDVVPYCIENKKAILAYSPLARGLLTGKMRPGHTFGEGDHRANLFYFNDENIKRANDFLEKIGVLAKEKNCSLTQLVIRWTLEQPGITVALVGARNEEQAVQNAKASDVSLTGDEIQFINTHLDRLELKGV